MKTTRLKKWSKRFLFTGIIVFSSLFIWANWEPSTITERLPEINIISYDLSSLKNESSYGLIQNEFKGKKGITACSVNSSSKIATFTFIPEIISQEAILTTLKSLGGRGVKEKVFACKAGCPVRGTTEFFGKIKQSLKVR